MSDKLLQELGRLARERQGADARGQHWEKLAAGTLPESDRAELERLAQADPEAGRAYDAFRPLDAAARERIAARLEASLAPAPPAARVVPLRRRTWPVAGALLAAAAAVTVVLVLPSRGGPPLPAYALSFTGVQEVRAEAPEAEVPRLEPGSQVQLVLRPARAVSGPVEVRAFLFKSGEGRVWAPPMEVSEDAAVRIRGRVEDLFPLAPGEWTLAVAVGRPGALPPEPRDVAPWVEDRGKPAPERWQLLIRRFQLVARP